MVRVYSLNVKVHDGYTLYPMAPQVQNPAYDIFIKYLYVSKINQKLYALDNQILSRDEQSEARFLDL